MKTDEDENPFTLVDLITLIISGITIVMIVVFMAFIGPVQASEGRNWCADYIDGYTLGYCWKECGYIPPTMCPYPRDGETDGYMRGLREGLEDREKK